MSVLSSGAATPTGSAPASAYASVNETQAVLDAAEASVKRLLAAREHVAEPNMRLIVHVLSSDQQHCVPFQSILMSVGQGVQTFKWLSLAVATRLRCFAATKRGLLRSHDRHELSGFFLPTAVNTARNAKMTLGATSVTDVLPTDRLCDVLKDGDEVFVALCVKPTMDDMNVINHTAWQREAFHAQDDAIAEQAVANALAQERSMYKPDSDVSWDADVATRLRDVLHVEPSTPMPPAAAAFGVPAPSPTYTTDAYSETVLETSERGAQATERWNPEAGASLPLWRESPEPLSNFDGDWRAMKTTSLWADQKELDSARAVLARAYPSLLEMFRLYATLGNVTSASKLPATGGSTPAASPTSPSPSAVGVQRAVAATRRDSGGRFGAPAPAAAASAVAQAAVSSPALRAGAVYEEPLVLTAAELEVFLRDTLCLNGATAGSLFPPALVAAVQRAITRQAAPAATALATGASSPQHPTRAGGSGGVSAGGASLFAAPDALSAMMSATTAAGGGGGGFTVTSTASSPAASPARAGSASGVTYMGFSTRPSERAALSTFRPQLTIPKLSAPGATGAGAVGGASGTPGALATPASAGTGAARMVGSRKVSDAGVGSPLVAGAKVMMQGASSPTAQPTTPNTFSSSLKGGARRVGKKEEADASVPAPAEVLHRVNFLDAVVLSALAVWDACKGDYRNFYVMLQGGGKTSSSGMGGDGEGGGMAGSGPTTGGGRKLGGGGPNAPGQSEAAMKRAAELNAAMQSASAGVLTTPLRASMLTQFLATFVTPRWKRWHSGDLRASMLSQGVGRLIFRELPLLKFAYSRYCVLIDLDAVFDVTSWRRMLIDTALYVRSDVRSHTSADATPSSGTRVYAGIDNLKGNRLSERDVVSCFVRVQGEDSDSSTPLLSEMDLDTLSAAFHAGGRALTSAAAAILAPYSFVPASGAVPQARQVISFMEWVEALCRVAIIKWDDPTMPLPEKAARAFDALAVRLSSEPGTPWRAGAEVQESTTKTSGGFRR